jgi:hypothetical protein
MKIDMLHNPNGAMRYIMHVLDNLGHFLYISRVFSKMDLKIENFDFLHRVYFWDSEIERNRPLRSFEVVRGH